MGLLYLYSFLLEAESTLKVIVRPEGLCQWKIPIISGIEPATFRLVAQCFNQLRQQLAPLRSVLEQYLLLGACAKFRKATTCFVLSCLSLRLSVRQHGTPRLPRDRLSLNLCLRIFRDFVKKIQLSLKSDKNNGYLTWRPSRTQGMILRKKSQNTKCAFWISLQFLSETFLIVRRTERNIIINSLNQPFSLINTPTFLKPSHSTPTCLWRWNRQSVPKRRHIKFRRQKKSVQHSEHGVSLKSMKYNRH
jgi:hypothetical protein